ncbi:hypothetical protein [Muricomes intestini]
MEAFTDVLGLLTLGLSSSGDPDYMSPNSTLNGGEHLLYFQIVFFPLISYNKKRFDREVEDIIC